MSFKYGVVAFSGAKVGDHVRWMANPTPGQPGVVLQVQDRSTANGILRGLEGTRGYVEVTDRPTTQVVAEGGSASGISIPLPVIARGSLRVS